MRALVRQALRMRPDRLVVGEVRGGEVVDLLAALNTGHEGGCGTLHANSAADVPARVEALALAAGLGREAAHSQLAAAVDVVVHLGIDAGGRRRLREVGVPERSGDGLVTIATAVSFDVDGRARPGPGADRLGAAPGRPVTACAPGRRRRAGRVPSADVPGRPVASESGGGGAGRGCGRCRCARSGRPSRPSWRSCSAGGAAGAHRLWRQRARAAVAEQTRDRVLECCDLLAAELAAGQPAEAALDQAAEAWPAHRPGGAVPGVRRRRTSRAAARGRRSPAPRGWPWSRRPGTCPTAPGTAWPTPWAEWRRRCATPGRPTAWSAASSRRRGPPPGWWPPCRCVALAIGAGSGGDPLAFLLGTPIGLACLAGGLGLGLAGLAWIERLASEAAR